MPVSHGVVGRRTKGSRSARRHRLDERTSATERRDRTYPTSSEYARFHFLASSEASRLFVAAVASGPCRPSMENMRRVKVRRWAKHSSLYFFFFTSCCRRTLMGSTLQYVAQSVSVMRTSKTVIVPGRQNPWAATSPRSSGAGIVPLAPAWRTSRLVWIRGSSVTAEGLRAWAQR